MVMQMFTLGISSISAGAGRASAARLLPVSLSEPRISRVLSVGIGAMGGGQWSGVL